ncbi:AAA family ATPase [Mesorhizobium sp. A623]
MRKAAQMNLVCGGLSETIVRETLKTVIGNAPEGAVHYGDYRHLHLSDLAVAIRPGVSAYRALDILDGLAEARTREAKAGKGGDGGSGTSLGQKSSSATSVAKNGRGNPGSGSEIIEPADPTDNGKDRFVFRVETLSGYGEAKDWALGLKSDLVLWRAGKLAWEDLSTKLLLSGPPGTGKTIFARALGNTLQVPLIVSSVASWLEPGYLGDVLKRMSAAFAEAEAHKPAILFIDEFDGIGQRGTTGDWVSYWNSVVNRLLELLDGAAKTDGVIIVGATNNAAIIDAALLRSGRLEKHIEIPRPDTAALIGILRHHLGDDLDSVVDSAPLQFPSDGATAESTPATDPELPITTGNGNPAPAKQTPTRKEAL